MEENDVASGCEIIKRSAILIAALIVIGFTWWFAKNDMVLLLEIIVCVGAIVLLFLFIRLCVDVHKIVILLSNNKERKLK